MKNNEKIKVGISLGDLNGIGIEIILKTFEDSRMTDFCTPILFGSSKVVSYHKKALGLETPIHGIDRLKNAIHNKVNLYGAWKDMVDLDLGKPTEASGSYAFKSLQSAVDALKEGEIDFLLTAPIDKRNIQSEAFNFKGHTEYLEAELEGKSLMILMSGPLRVGLITGHIPLKEVAEHINEEIIIQKTELLHDSLRLDFGISKPKIALLGLNPHSGDQGLIGKEDEEIIRPAVEKMQQSGKLIYGPYAADGFFGSANHQNFDGIMAMYHDQGLVPFKTLAFGKGVNFTAGLSEVRTSPDHGTGFDIAGKNKADHGSFKEALFAGIEIFKRRRQNLDLMENKLQKAKVSRKHSS